MTSNLEFHRVEAEDKVLFTLLKIPVLSVQDTYHTLVAYVCHSVRFAEFGLLIRQFGAIKNFPAIVLCNAALSQTNPFSR